MNRKAVSFLSIVVPALIIGASVSAENRRTSYTRVKVALMPAHTPDAAFNRFRKQFIEATSKKNADALFALVAPGFVWTHGDNVLSGYDPGRDAQHNFKVVFGFRAPDKDVDGPVEGGPFWDVLTAFANDGTHYRLSETGSLVCSPIAASIVDPTAFERARTRIDPLDDVLGWYFSLRSTPVTHQPAEKSTPISTIELEAFPVVNVHPSAGEGASPTHYQILLPSGRNGWIPASVARPIVTERLCYALTANGDWKIAIFSMVD